jgi:hypothetical protein
VLCFGVVDEEFEVGVMVGFVVVGVGVGVVGVGVVGVGVVGVGVVGVGVVGVGVVGAGVGAGVVELVSFDEESTIFASKFCVFDSFKQIIRTNSEIELNN